MKTKKITLISKDNDIIYKVAAMVYSLNSMPVKKINIIGQNKAIIYYAPYKTKRTLSKYINTNRRGK